MRHSAEMTSVDLAKQLVVLDAQREKLAHEMREMKNLEAWEDRINDFRDILVSLTSSLALSGGMVSRAIPFSSVAALRALRGADQLMGLWQYQHNVLVVVKDDPEAGRVRMEMSRLPLNDSEMWILNRMGEDVLKSQPMR